MSLPIHKAAVLLGVAAVSTLSLHAFPIAVPGTEGFSVIVAGTGPIIATYEGNSASYSNDLYLELDAGGNPGMDGITSNDLFIFNNHASPVGSTLNLGSFLVGAELVFRLHVNNTGDDFFSGPASRNSDSLPHARVQGNWAPNVTLVSFEDLYGTPEGVNGYNDLSFSFSNTSSSGNPIPEASSQAAGLALVGMMALSARRRMRR
jgi:hypothetical protein